METFLSLGVVSFGLAIILGITSLPSVTDVLTWKEFAFVQSKLGWLCLCFGTAHDLFMGFKYIFIEPPILCGFFLTATTVSSKFQTLSTVKLPFWSKFCLRFFLIKKIGKYKALIIIRKSRWPSNFLRMWAKFSSDFWLESNWLQLILSFVHSFFSMLSGFLDLP